jgi:soluble lytic murein transglycosylase-like protein
MRKNLQAILMAGVTASLLSTIMTARPALAESDGITATKDTSGRTVYVNDLPAPRGAAGSHPEATSAAPPRKRLMYWSTTEHRFKPVPTSGAVMRAARSAASEVNSYLGAKQLSGAAAGSTAPESRTISGPGLNMDFARPALSGPEINAAIEQAAERHQVDPNLVRSIIKVESNFNPNAVSRKGAMGLMQLMPATARSLNVSNPFDPQQNVDAGVRHLRQLLDSYGGDVRLSLAAYNAGAGAVARSAGVPKFAETRNYVQRITDLYAGRGEGGTRVVFAPMHTPVRVERDARGVLFISNTD